MLGGTEFVGRAVVEEGLSRGWDVSVLNRGTHRPPTGVTALRGDRTAQGGLRALEGLEWDVVVDTWSWAPVAVRDAARSLAGRAGHYVYVSSRSVYAYPAPPGAAEDAPLVEGAADDRDAVDYARAKAGGELAAIESFGDTALLLRAGLILGPYENIGRLPWWLRRIAKGGSVPAPGPAGLPLQYIDVRDLAVWALDAAGRGLGGAYNVVSPPGHTTMGELLEACLQVTSVSGVSGGGTGSGAVGGGVSREDRVRLRWISPDRISAVGVEPWTELPIWLPPGETYDSTHRADVSKALAMGLRCRPVVDTVADTWAWLCGLDGDPPLRPDRPRVGLSARAEAALLA